MTQLPARRSLGQRHLWADGAVGLVVLWWAVPIVRSTGGREPHVLSIGLVLLLAATAAVQPWRSLPTGAYAALVGLPAAAFLVVAVAPTGWDGAVEAGSWAFASQLAALLLAWARDVPRRAALLLALVLSAGYEFGSGWLAWWGGENPARPFVGTFYWHNQAGVFLATGSVVAAGLLVARVHEARLAAWFVAPLALAGTVVTTSRASMAALAVGYVGLAGLAVTRPGRVRSLVQVGAAAALGVGLAVLLTGPPFFHERTSALAGATARGQAGETLAVNGQHRLDDWGWAWRLFRDRPLTGTGFHGFAAGSAQLDPAGDGALTPFAHNGYLQVLAEGGLLLAVPVLMVLLLLARRGLQGWRDPLSPPALAGLAVLLLHSGVDFDWSYPALLAAPALLVAALPGEPSEGTSGRRGALLGAVAAGLIALGAVAAWHESLDLSARLS